MSKSKKPGLQKIYSNKTSGSSELFKELHEHLKGQKVFLELFPDFVDNIKKQFLSFQNIQNYLKDLESNLVKKKKLDEFFGKYDSLLLNQYDLIFEKAENTLLKYNSFITLSNSNTVKEILLRLFHHNNKIKAVVSESRPKNEGILLAKNLSKAGIDTTLITESMLAQYIKSCDAALIGADAILQNKNVINKVGSLSLALLCKYFKKPIYVLADKGKISSANKFSQKEMPPEEIWRHGSNKIKIKNYYFEEVDQKYITKIFTC